MLIVKVIVTFLVGYLAGSAINFLADKLSSAYTKPGIDKHIRQVDYPLPRFMWDKTTADWTIRHWIIQFSIPICFIVFYIYEQPVIQSNLIMVVFLLFTLISVIDIEHHFILRSMIFAGYVLAFVTGIVHHNIISTITGFFGGFSLMLAFYLLGRLFSKKLKYTAIRDEKFIPLGFGDVHLGGIIGLLLGWPGVIEGIFLGVIAAGVYSAVILLFMVVKKNYQPGKVIPYAPFLLGAALLLLAM